MYIYALLICSYMHMNINNNSIVTCTWNIILNKPNNPQIETSSNPALKPAVLPE
jgi:hypothetical protein